MATKEKTGLEPSEFIANQTVDVNYRQAKEEEGTGLVPCPSRDEGAKFLRIKKGEPIPKLFVPNFLERNRNFIKDMQYKEGLPFITPEQEKEYGVKFKKPKTEKPLMSIYSTENLYKRIKKMGGKAFKEWAEKQFGADNIDRRKSPRGVADQIRRIVG